MASSDYFKVVFLFTLALPAATASEDSEGTTVNTADIVRIFADKETVMSLQSGHGGYNEYMDKSLGRIGKVELIEGDGDVKVEVCGYTWYYNSAALTVLEPESGFFPAVNTEDCEIPAATICITKDRVRGIGQIVDLDCTVSSNATSHTPSIRWVKDGFEISSNSRVNIMDPRYKIRSDNTSTSYTLQIRDIRVEDAGLYKCEYRYMEQLAAAESVNLRVTLPIEFTENSTRSVMVSEGSGAKLECYAEGLPEPQITWHRVVQESVAPVDDLIYRGNILEIGAVRVEDAGAYYCVADNGEDLTLRWNVSLEVTSIPRTTLTSQGNAETTTAAVAPASPSLPDELREIHEKIAYVTNSWHFRSEAMNERLKAIELEFIRPETDRQPGAVQ